MAANFGWDWGPRLLTAGIWRAVHLERWHEARLDAIRAHATRANGGSPPGRARRGERRRRARGGAELPSTDRCGSICRCTTRAAASSPTRAVTLTGRVVAGHRDRHGRRRPTLVPDRARRAAAVRRDVTLECDDVLVDRAARRVGFRDVVLDTTPMGRDGAAFAFVVNGRRTWIRGVQLDPRRLLSRPGDAAATRRPHRRGTGGQRQPAARVGRRCLRVRRLLRRMRPPRRARVAGLRLRLRGVPRGAARRRGARRGHRQRRSAGRPPEPARLVRQQREPVGFADWGWPEQLAGRSWGEGFYRSLLPDVLADRDPRRPYLDGTPTSLDPAVHPNDARSRHGPPVGRLELRGLRPLPHARAAFRRRVRLPGAGDAPDARASARRPPARPRRSGAGAPPEGDRWSRQAGPVA